MGEFRKQPEDEGYYLQNICILTVLFTLNLTNLTVKTTSKQQTDGFRYKHLFPLNHLNIYPHN